MIILGIETSTPSGGAAILDDDRILACMIRWGGRSHSQRVLAGIKSMLDDLGLQPEQLGGLAVSIGPGSFTGVRVGLAAAKALSYAAEIPLAGVSTLEAFAWRALGPDSQGRLDAAAPLIIPALDARRGEAYWSLFDPLEREADGSMKRLAPDTMTRSERLAETIAAALASIELNANATQATSQDGGPPASVRPAPASARPVIVCGEGALKARAELESRLGERLRIPPPARQVPGPEEVAWLGMRKIKAGHRDDPRTLMPIYLREPDVQFPRRLAAKI